MNTNVTSFTDHNFADDITTKNHHFYRKKKTQPDQSRKNLYGYSSLTKYTQRNAQTASVESAKAKKVRQIQKKHNKGPLKKKIIQTWLNNILTQYTQLQTIDINMGNAALKQYQIDQNAMLTKGIKPQNIQRIYQALFVHSIGFNNSIKQLVRGSQELTKNIWKVFSVLLEYCAQGKFQTLVGVIEREKQAKVQEMKEEIIKRQLIIDRNDELNQHKNIQIFKEIRYLKQQYEILKNEKQLLNQNYQRTQQSFVEQFSLRLKFENKINELFGVHRQLGNKHKILYDDYKKRLNELNAIKIKNNQIFAHNSQLKIQVQNLTYQKQKLLYSQKNKSQIFTITQQQNRKLHEQYTLLKHQYQNQRRVSRQNHRRISQLQLQLKSFAQITSLKDASWHEINSELKNSIDQNKKICLIIDEQRNQINSLLYQKKQYNNKIIYLLADNSFQKKKKQQFMSNYYTSEKSNKLIKQQYSKIQLENKILSTRVNSLEEDIQINYQNIDKMHINNDLLQNQNAQLRKYKQNFNQLIKQVKLQNIQFQQKISKLQQQISQLQTTLYKNDIAMKIMKAQLQTQAQTCRQKYDRITQQRQTLLLGDNQKNRQLISTKLQFQKTTKILHTTILQLKNQKFQRVHIKANYQQSLNLLQKKNYEEKQLRRNISQLTDNVFTITQSKNFFQQGLSIQTERKNKWEQQFIDLKKTHEEYKKNKSSHIHPMIFEDLVQCYRLLQQKLSKTQLQLSIKAQQIQQLDQKHKSKQQTLIKSHNQSIKSLLQQKSHQLQQKQNQIQYQKQMYNKIKSKIQYFQNLTLSFTKKIQQQKKLNKQQAYLDLLQEKTKSLQLLTNQLNLQIHNNQLLKFQIIKIKQDNNDNFIKLKKQFNSQVQGKNSVINDLTLEKQYYQKQANKMKQQLKQQQLKLQQKVQQSIKYLIQTYKSIHQNQPKNLNNIDKKQMIQINKNFKQKTQQKMQKIQKKHPQIKKRNQLSRKLQNAYTYYQSNNANNANDDNQF